MAEKVAADTITTVIHLNVVIISVMIKSGGNFSICEVIKMEEYVKKFIGIPVVFLIGVYVAGAMIEEFFGIPEAATYLFAAIGGIGFLAYYFRGKLFE